MSKSRKSREHRNGMEKLTDEERWATLRLAMATPQECSRVSLSDGLSADYQLGARSVIRLYVKDAPGPVPLMMAVEADQWSDYELVGMAMIHEVIVSALPSCAATLRGKRRVS